MGSHTESYLVVGAGVFGASTALQLRRADPSASVTLLDRTPFPNPSAASHDLNKIVRADYGDIFYTRLGLEAMELWRNDPIFKDYFHETGMAFTEPNGMGRKAIENYKTIGGDSEAGMVPVDEMRTRFGGIFKESNWTGAPGDEIFWNPKSGWAEAEGALRSIIQAAVDQGVKYHQATISTLLIENGVCSGVNTTDSGVLKADHILLCSGAWTGKILADTAPDNKDLQLDGRAIAAGACSGIAVYDPELREAFQKAPVFFNGLTHTSGESIPTNADGKLKFNCEISFTNTVYHEASKQKLSVPPTPISQTTWSQDIPQGLKDDLQRVMLSVYGQNVKGLEMESYRMCWDAVTPNQDFIICPHPHCKGLYVATGGSFHGWKFMPVIGSYVVKMLHGKLDEATARRWGWDRSNDGAACEPYIPKRDLKDVPGYDEIGK